MRAARLLQILLLLQNRGRQTSAMLAAELEVAQRTILRDVDAMTEAGLPIIVHRGPSGGVELGFNYRTRLTGLAADEAEALAVILAVAAPALDQLGMAKAGARARAKLIESFPDGVRERIEAAQSRFLFVAGPNELVDERIPALAAAIRDRRRVLIRARDADRREIHPAALEFDGSQWRLIDRREPATSVPAALWGDINISNRSFDLPGSSDGPTASRPSRRV